MHRSPGYLALKMQSGAKYTITGFNAQQSWSVSSKTKFNFLFLIQDRLIRIHPKTSLRQIIHHGLASDLQEAGCDQTVD